MSVPLAPVPDLFGEVHPFKECAHEGHVCDTRCDTCGCCEHCAPNCGCEVAYLPSGIRCPDFDCACEGYGPDLTPHPPRPRDADGCTVCDGSGVVGGDRT